MNNLTLSWSIDETPKELCEAMKLLAEYYSIIENGSGTPLQFRKGGDGLKIELRDGVAVITFSQTCLALRAVGTLLSGLVKPEGEIVERVPFNTVGIMLECSRNAVIKVEHVKKWLRKVALLGYNMVMLYCKDTYELPGEDYFGYLRGRYTADELREIDAYAKALGVEMVGCVQALGHLEPILRWPAYARIKDTSSVLLTTEEKSYELIEKIIDFYESVYSSRRIHLGMDETHDLGRGRYMDINGYRRGFDIFNEHLARVVGMCKSRGMKPMIWSDMYFRMSNKRQDYYDRNSFVPPDVKAEIPSSVQLTYWDYYHEDQGFYCEWIKRHRDLGFEPVMASGVWTWLLTWYNHAKTKKTVDPCIEACMKENLQEIIFTMWGDDGSYCDYDSALAGLCYVAEKIYSFTPPDEESLRKRFLTVCGGDYDAHLKASEMTEDRTDGVSAASLLWDDPLLGIYWKNKIQDDPLFWPRIQKKYEALFISLKGVESGDAGDIIHVGLLLDVLNAKLDIKARVETAYATRDFAGIEDARMLIPEISARLERLADSFRSQWYARNKPFGWEVIQLRLAGQMARFKELDTRLFELLHGETESIPELDEKAYPMKRSVDPLYSMLATGSYFL